MVNFANNNDAKILSLLTIILLLCLENTEIDFLIRFFEYMIMFLVKK